MCKYRSIHRSDYECKKSPWEKSEEGYCIFHEPGKDKDVRLFEVELKREKLDQHDYDFIGFVFPGDTSYFEGREFESNVDFTEVVFLGDMTNFSFAQFSGDKTDFSFAQFLGDRTSFSSTQFLGDKTDFFGAQFSSNEADFSKAEFSGDETDFNDATFSGDRTSFFRATFSGDRTSFGSEFSGGRIDFRYATFSGDWANFVNARFSGDRIDFSYATFSGDETSFYSVDLKGADFSHADLNGAYLSGADLRNAILIEANLENANVTDVKYNRKGKYRGIRVATCYGSPRFKRFAQDQDFIEEFRESWCRKPLYLLWLASCDCGRSFPLLAGWSVIVALFFASIYFCHIGPSAFQIDSNLPETFGTFLYYSVVTLTTLGFGDITPDTPCAARWVMVEVIIGYIMLGLLISIFATKVARRS